MQHTALKMELLQTWLVLRTCQNSFFFLWLATQEEERMHFSDNVFFLVMIRFALVTGTLQKMHKNTEKIRESYLVSLDLC